MKTLSTFLLLAFTTIATAQLTTQEQALDSVYLDTKVKQQRKNSGKVVTVITQEMLERSQGKTVATIINETSGIQINGVQSNDGQNLGYFVRGSRNRQVVIMVDGVQLNDPSSISNDFDLRLLPTNNIQRIEIVKGASSVLYGSGAAAAVINITTKKASKNSIAATFSSTVGTNNQADKEENTAAANEFTNYARVNGTANWFFYDVDFSHRFVDGISAVAAPEGEVPNESDAFQRFNVKARAGAKINENIQFSQFVSIDDFTAEFDDFSYIDANNKTFSRQIRTGGNFTWKFNRGTYVFNDSYSWIERDVRSSFPSKFNAESYTLDTYVTYRFTDKLTGLLGLNYNTSEFESFSIPFGETAFAQNIDSGTANFDIIDPYVNLNYVSSFGFQLSAGARLNNHSNYGSHVVYNVNPSYRFDIGNNSIKALASYSTAYITPSLFQLYDPSFGNTELEPEENRTIEGGVEVTLGKNTRFSAVYFNREETNFVDFVTVDPDLFISQYQNIGTDFIASGVEVEVSHTFNDNVQVMANYTNTQADESLTLRIPEHKANANITYNFSKDTYVGASYQFVGERTDSFFNNETFLSEIITLESYGLLDFTAATTVLPNMKVFVNASNILDEEYEELFRFQTKGRNFRVGFTLDF